MARERTEAGPPMRLHRVRSHLIASLSPPDRLVLARILQARADWHALLAP